MITEEKLLASARTQYRTMFKSMAFSGVNWNFHIGSAGPVLLQHGAKMDVPLPVLLTNIQAMQEETMINRLADAWRKAPAWLPHWKAPA